MLNEEDRDRMALIFTGPSLLAGLFGGFWAWLAARGQDATAWLIQHNILVPADQALVRIYDAGLDAARCALIVAIIILTIWGSISIARRKHPRTA